MDEEPALAAIARTHFSVDLTIASGFALELLNNAPILI
jgi:hypothetical protein